MNPHIEWETTELHNGEKTNDWFWALGIIMGTIAIISFVFNNIIFGIFIIMVSLSLVVHAKAKPKMSYYAITKDGLIVENKMYLYSNLDHFHIEDFRDRENEHPTLRSRILIRNKSFIYPILYIPIHEKIDLHEVQEILSKYIKEQRVEETAFHKILERFI